MKVLSGMDAMHHTEIERSHKRDGKRENSGESFFIALAKALKPVVPTSRDALRSRVMANIAVRVNVNQISLLLKALSFLSSGVAVSTALSTNEVIVPNCVLFAIPVITAFPFPFITDAPLNTILSRSPRAVSFGSFSVFFSDGSDSPVSDDSSHCN